jgi:hypothetical protein
LTCQSTYTGTTTVSNGVLALANNPDNGMEGSISASAIITLGAGTILDVSGRSDGTLQLNAGQILEGYGTINGAIDASYGGSFSPGGGSAGGIGTLTITGDISIGTGTDWMKLDRSASPNSDRLVSSGGSITHLGDSLVVTNIGAPLQAGDTFTLFTNATTGYSYYTSITLPSSYIWNTNQLAANGTITVISVLPHPSVTKADFSNFAGGSLTLNATNGVPNATVTILSSTNLASPFGSWTVVTNTTFDANGNLKDPNTGDPGLIITNLVNDQPTRFYLLKTQ